MTQLGAVALRRVAGASGEVDDDGDAQLFGQQDRLAADFAIVLGARRVGMQRIAVAAQGADGEAVVFQDLLELGECGVVVQHGELAVRVAGIVAGAEFDGVDAVGL